jgi:RNA polymerase sigma factor (sigma-70 family)
MGKKRRKQMSRSGRRGTRLSDGEAEAREAMEVRLIGLTAKGDLPAFESLYRVYFPRLTRFVGGMTRSAHLIEEIVNDTMLVVWQKAQTFNHTSKVSTWLFAIAYRKAMKAISAFDDPMESDHDDYPALESAEPEIELNRLQIQRLLQTALDALPLEQRNVVSLAYYHGMGYEEIADIMDCPVNTVKTRMFHARRRMKAVLSPLMEEMR